MKIEHKCLTCHFCAPDLLFVIAGKKTYLCLRAPPSPVLVQTRANEVMTATVYPTVSEFTASCGAYEAARHAGVG